MTVVKILAYVAMSIFVVVFLNELRWVGRTGLAWVILGVAFSGILTNLAIVKLTRQSKKD